LCERFASTSGVTITTEFPDTALEARVNPFILQLLVFLCLDAYFKHPVKNSSVTIGLTAREGSCTLLVRGPGGTPREALEPAVEQLRRQAGACEVPVDISGNAETGHTYTFHL
jgi:hypothetical protein